MMIVSLSTMRLAGRMAGRLPYQQRTGLVPGPHAVRIIGDGSNHWSLVHVDDIAELYTLALDASSGSVYAGVATADFTVAQIGEAASRAAGCTGRVESVTVEQAREETGPIADAFALDQQVSSARARDQLGWNPPNRDVLREIAEGRDLGGAKPQISDRA